MGTSVLNAVGNPAKDPIQDGVGIFLVALCYRNWDNLQPCGPLGSNANLIIVCKFKPVFKAQSMKKKNKNKIYYMISSVSGQDKQILHYDWLPKQARWSYILPSWDTSFVPQGRFIMFWCFIPYINPLLTKLVQSRWLDIIFCMLMDLDFISVH